MLKTPSFLNFEVLSKWNSNYNTPPIFSIYIFHGILEWIKKQGGINAMRSTNEQKRKILYDAIDEFSDFYFCIADKQYRSNTTVPFRIGSKKGNVDLENKFLEEAKTQGMIQLNGHMTVGGIRVALYNSITVDNLTTLVTFMKYFYKDNAVISKKV
ncbi:probable phosphoserine aminotransferase [Condylostylus longicornis]|uniref:probable phosphoserine aminotransferase n=1 Tax=Condylostylus longicornis TaxID=2530218 RepID=UPI00244DD8DA|nr:probable phosphoserine aminotransferase [Condylostylus longicornis]